MPDRLTPADGDRNPLEALADVSCQHTRHYAMCASCACAAVRPEVERLRAELAEARLVAGAVADMQRLETYLAALQRAEQAEAAIARQRAALGAFDGRGVNNLDVPTPAEILDAWRAALDASTAPESRPANSKEILSGSGSAPESPQEDA